MINEQLTEIERISLYMELTDAIVTSGAGKWEISTPQETIVCGSFDELIDNIDVCLGFMEEAYQNNNEMGEWDAAVKRATGYESLHGAVLLCNN